jgi:hypothetical protein
VAIHPVPTGGIHGMRSPKVIYFQDKDGGSHVASNRRADRPEGPPSCRFPQRSTRTAEGEFELVR